MDLTPSTVDQVHSTGEGILVVTYPQTLSGEQHSKICAVLRQRFPDRKWLVLDGGATVQDTAAVQRTEAKVDLLTAMVRQLLETLAEEEPDDSVAQSLDGGPRYQERNPNESLG